LILKKHLKNIEYIKKSIMHKFISAESYMERANVIFSACVSKENIEKYLQSDFEIISESNEFFLIKNTNLKIKENDTIFCNTDLVFDLFSLLKNVRNLENLKLITHQSDTTIDKKYYEKKPECIDKWFAINVEFNAKNLIPIPIGLASSFQKKYLNNVNISNYINDEFQKEYLLYVNFNPNTNTDERSHLLKYFKQIKWAKIDDSPVALEEYVKNIKQSYFVLCPWGNGIDTHRLWEALYLSSTPITKKHNTLMPYNKLPIYFVNDYSEINESSLLKSINKFENHKNQMELDIDYWDKKFKAIQIKSFENVKINDAGLVFLIKKIKFNMKLKTKSRIKLINYYLNKIYNRLKL
tara:strand:+ start:4840 stop:5898 length:1059 start_codon:yes stop_codon:yes gene_type:complete